MSIKDLKIVESKDVIDNIEWYVRKTVEINEIVYKEESYEGMIENYVKWFDNNKDVSIFLMDVTDGEYEMVGYLTTMPIRKELFEEIKAGGIDDTRLSYTDILPFEDNNSYSLYFCSIVVKPEYQSTRAFTVLFDGYMDMIYNLAKDRNIYINEIVAQAVTKKGGRLCRLSGLKSLVKVHDELEIYYSDSVAKDFRSTSCAGRRVHDLYQEQINIEEAQVLRWIHLRNLMI